MIEKLDVMKDTRNVIDKDGIVHTVANFTAIDKINELVDAVNNLQTSNTHIQKDLFEMRHLEAKENAQDKFAEQRKWIGKLCRFWNFKDGAVDIGILKAVDNLKPTIPYINDIDCSYAYCEPVSPDDDIIYKGGNNVSE